MTDELHRKRWDKADYATDLSPIEAARAALDRVDWPKSKHCIIFVMDEDEKLQMFNSGKLEPYAQLGFAYRALHKLLMDND